MKKLLSVGLLVAAGLMSAQPALADDAAIAGKLKGEWNGKWVFTQNGFADRFVLIVTGVEGNTIKGEGHWFGTMTGDQKLPISKGEVKDGKIFIEQPNDTKMTLKLDEQDGKSKLAGDWVVSGYAGTINANKQ